MAELTERRALGNANVFDGTRRFIRSVRDVDHLASSDTIQTAYYRAALTSLGPTDQGNNLSRQGAFATFGLAHLNNLIGSIKRTGRSRHRCMV